MPDNMPWIAFNPQVFHYAEAEVEVERLLNYHLGRRASLGSEDEATLGGRAVPIVPSAASGCVCSMDETVSRDYLDRPMRPRPPSEPVAGSPAPDWVEDDAHPWRSIYLAVNNLYLSAKHLLNAQGIDPRNRPLPYPEWCEEKRVSCKSSISSPLNALRIVRNNLTAHRRIDSSFERPSFVPTEWGYIVYCGENDAELIGSDHIEVDTDKAKKFFCAVRELWFEVLRQRAEGREIPSHQTLHLQWHPCDDRGEPMRGS